MVFWYLLVGHSAVYGEVMNLAGADLLQLHHLNLFFSSRAGSIQASISRSDFQVFSERSLRRTANHFSPCHPCKFSECSLIRSALEQRLQSFEEAACREPFVREVARRIYAAALGQSVRHTISHTGSKFAAASQGSAAHRAQELLW